MRSSRRTWRRLIIIVVHFAANVQLNKLVSMEAIQFRFHLCRFGLVSGLQKLAFFRVKDVSLLGVGFLCFCNETGVAKSCHRWIRQKGFDKVVPGELIQFVFDVCGFGSLSRFD